MFQRFSNAVTTVVSCHMAASSTSSISSLSLSLVSSIQLSLGFLATSLILHILHMNIVLSSSFHGPSRLSYCPLSYRSSSSILVALLSPHGLSEERSCTIQMSCSSWTSNDSSPIWTKVLNAESHHLRLFTPPLSLKKTKATSITLRPSPGAYAACLVQMHTAKALPHRSTILFL